MNFYFSCYDVTRSVIFELRCYSKKAVQRARNSQVGVGVVIRARNQQVGWLIQHKLLVREGIDVSSWGYGGGWMSLIHVRRLKDGQQKVKVQTAKNPKDTSWGLGWGFKMTQ